MAGRRGGGKSGGSEGRRPHQRAACCRALYLHLANGSESLAEQHDVHGGHGYARGATTRGRFLTRNWRGSMAERPCLAGGGRVS